MTLCNDCEVLPTPLPETGVLYLSPPLQHTLTGLRKFLAKNGFSTLEPYAGVLAIPYKTGDLKLLSSGLAESFSDAEIQDTKSLILNQGQQPTLQELIQMQPLSTLFSKAEGAWLVDMLRENRVFTDFQPIVECRRTDQVFAYECLLRGRQADGKVVSPKLMFDAARSSSLLFYLDRTARQTAIHSVSQHGLRSRVFINFNPSSIYDPAYCLLTTFKAIKAAGIAPQNIVFEVVESDEIKDPDQLVKILAVYRENGFGVALDDLGSGYSSLNMLTRLKPDFIKLDIHLVRDVDRDPYKAVIARRLLEMAQDLGIKTVAEGIETESEWQWVKQHGVDYVQGYLFAKPGSPPPTPRAFAE